MTNKHWIWTKTIQNTISLCDSCIKQSQDGFSYELFCNPSKYCLSNHSNFLFPFCQQCAKMIAQSLLYLIVLYLLICWQGLDCDVLNLTTFSSYNIRMSNNQKGGKGKGKNKNKGNNKGPQEVEVKTAVAESDEMQYDSIMRDAIQSSEVKPEKQETSTTHDEKSNTELSRSEESSLKTDQPLPQVDHTKVEVVAQSKESETSEIPPKAEEASPLQSQNEPTVAQGQAKQEEEEPRRIHEETLQQVHANVESSEIKELHSAEVKIEEPQRQPETEQVQQGNRDTTEFEIISSGDFTNVTHLQTQPVAVEAKPQPEPHQEATEHREVHSQAREAITEVHQEPNPYLTTEILVQHKQNSHAEQSAEQKVEDQPVVPEHEAERQVDTTFQHVQQRVEQQPRVEKPPCQAEEKHEDLHENKANHEAEHVRKHEPEVKHEVAQEQVEHPVVHHQEEPHHVPAPQPVHQQHEEVHVQHEKRHEQHEKPSEKHNQSHEPVIERHHETVIEPNKQQEKVEIHQGHQEQISAAGSQEVIDLNKPIDEDEPVIKKKPEQRLFRLVESNQISINESNEIQVEKSLQANRSDEIKVPVQSSISFSDLNYSVERSVNASQEYDRISNPIHQVERIEQAINAHPLLNDEPVRYDPVPQEAEPSHGILISQPVVVLEESINNGNIPEEMFYSIVPESEVVPVVEVAVDAEPEEVAELPAIVEVVAPPAIVEVVQPVEVVPEPKIDERKEKTAHIKIEVEPNVKPEVQIEKVEVPVASNPVEVEPVHQVAPEEVVEPVQEQFEPVLQAAQPEPAAEEPELPPVPERMEASERALSEGVVQVDSVEPPKEQKPKKRSALSKIAISTVIGGSIIGGGFFLLPNKKPISLIAGGLVSVATYFFA